jgi:hypothetical protein
MFVKLTASGQPSQYPYTLGNLRRENSQTSFPKHITNELLAEYNVYPVQTSAAPDFDSKTHSVKQSVDLVDGVWTQVWLVVQIDEPAASNNVRAHRNKLISDTDWMALTDNTMTPEWASYRQELRDVTGQSGFPFAVVWPTEPQG